MSSSASCLPQQASFSRCGIRSAAAEASTSVVSTPRRCSARSSLCRASAASCGLPEPSRAASMASAVAAPGSRAATARPGTPPRRAPPVPRAFVVLRAMRPRALVPISRRRGELPRQYHGIRAHGGGVARHASSRSPPPGGRIPGRTPPLLRVTHVGKKLRGSFPARGRPRRLLLPLSLSARVQQRFSLFGATFRRTSSWPKL